MSNPRPELTCTRRCRNSLDDSFCYHFANGNCWFAHSDADLRCEHFSRTGVCLNGPSCRLSHFRLEHVPSSPDEIRYWGRKPWETSVHYVVVLPLHPMPPEYSAFVPYSSQDVREKRCSAVVHFREVLKRYMHGADQPFPAAASVAIVTKQDYIPRLTQLQFVEELFNIIDLRGYQLHGILLTARRDKTLMFEIPVPGLAENRPSVLRGDAIHVKVHGGSSNEWFGGRVHFVNVDSIDVAMPEQFGWAWQSDTRCEVVFTVSRTQDRVRHEAIHKGLFIDAATALEITDVDGAVSIATGGACHHQLPLNAEQQRLVDMTAAPRSHRVSVLWGPPGTGKTTTLTAAIVEALFRSRDVTSCRILVCTPSNEAADVIVERLHSHYVSQPALRHLFSEAGSILRVNGQMRTAKYVHDVVLKYSTPDDHGGFRLPSVETVKGARIVVCTLMTSGKLRAIDVPDRHFTHLFVDEAGHATEADLLIATMVAPRAKRIVLAGDHKQLGAVVRAPPCIDAGMAVSPLERLMQDARLVDRPQHVMLTHNYRSHPAIVHLVNAVYMDKLVPSRPLSAAEAAAGSRSWSLAFRHNERECRVSVHPDHPVAFLHHKGMESRENDSPSWMNAAEAHIAVQLALSLQRDRGYRHQEIAILSPYRKQVKKIEQILFHELKSDRSVEFDERGRPKVAVKVSTVEMFQGRESRAVILSCVRNGKTDNVETDIRFGIGFLKQPQRANVSMSRAKELLIVAGNAELLASDPLWRAYLDRMRAMPNPVLWDLTRTVGGIVPQLTQVAMTPLTDLGSVNLHDAVTSAQEERPFERAH